MPKLKTSSGGKKVFNNVAKNGTKWCKVGFFVLILRFSHKKP